MNALKEQYGKEIEQILKKYPEDQRRSGVMPLLYIAQREDGYVTKVDMQEIAEVLDIAVTEVAGIVGFYTLYHEKPGGKYRIQVCNDLPCALQGADEFLERLCANVGIKVGETTEDGIVTVEGVMCLAGCDTAPMFQVQTTDGIAYYENQTLDGTLDLIEKWRREEGSK